VGPGEVELEGRVILAPGFGEVRLAVEQVGGCRSEEDRWLGLAPHKEREPIGHEIAGHVVEIGAGVTTLAIGDRVAVQADGGFAEQVVVPAAWCVRVPESFRYPALVEPAGCIVGSVEQVDPPLGAVTVIVGGTGSMGELLQWVSLQRGPRYLVVTGRRPDALERARALGAVPVNTGEESLVAVVNELTDGEGADVVYDCGGVEDTLRMAVRVAKPTGVVGVVGFPQGDVNTPWGDIIGKRLRLEVCHFTKERLVPAMRGAVRLLATGAIREDDLVSNVFPFAELPDAFRLAAEKPAGFSRWVLDVTAR
jgi:threonine dehydrogenase-like Zn-dependent dehydrogenase